MKLKKVNFGLSIFFVFLLNACSHDDVGSQDMEQGPNLAETPEPIVISSENTLGVLAYHHEVYSGYTLFTIFKDTYLINNCGQVVNHWKSEYVPGNAVYLLEDGSILRAGKIDNEDMPYGGLGGIVERIGWDGQILWSYEYSNANATQHHDIFPMPNGNVLLLAATKKNYAEAIQAGRDPSKIDDGTLYNEQLLEIQPNGTHGGTVIWEWNIWDHLVQEFDNTKDNFGIVANNPQLLDINYLGGGGNNSDADWLHINSLDYNKNLDQILLSINGLDELYIIDHSTTSNEAASHKGGLRGKGGNILYRWGNPQSYKQGTLADRKLFKQHAPHWIPSSYPDGGKIMLYNNGNGRSESFSSVDIINPPSDGPGNYVLETNSNYAPNEPDWIYVDPVNPTNFYSKLLSSAQRLPNGNTLICEGLKGHIFEINPENNIVWKYINPETTDGTILKQGDQPESNRLFRAKKYPKDYIAFIGKNMSPKNPIETNFNIGNCK